VHRGEHEPILSRDLFEAVQAKRAANAVDRQVRLRGSAAILTGRLFDDRGNRMSPTHTNKQSARYLTARSQRMQQCHPRRIIAQLRGTLKTRASSVNGHSRQDWSWPDSASTPMTSTKTKQSLTMTSELNAGINTSRRGLECSCRREKNRRSCHRPR
jgi:hypothetical protein